MAGNPKEPPKQAAIFIHVPKTGGTSINYAFNRKLDPQWGKRPLIWTAGHRQAKEIMQSFPEQWAQSRFKFAFVRNPWDRYVSWFYYKQKTTKTRHGPSLMAPVGTVQLRDQFRTWLEKKDPDSLLGTYNRSARRLLCDAHENILVDKVFRFEKFDQEVGRLCVELGVPPKVIKHENQNKRKPEIPDYRVFYDDWSRGFVEGLCWWEIQRFEYVF